MNRGGHKNRITKEQREAIIAAFVAAGFDAAQQIASQLGLSHDYAKRLIYARGLA